MYTQTDACELGTQYNLRKKKRKILKTSYINKQIGRWIILSESLEYNYRVTLTKFDFCAFLSYIISLFYYSYNKLLLFIIIYIMFQYMYKTHTLFNKGKIEKIKDAFLKTIAFLTLTTCTFEISRNFRNFLTKYLFCNSQILGSKI